MSLIREEFMGVKRTNFMKGMEIEKTPAFGRDTLFVQNFQKFEDIKRLCIEHNINHVYLGANLSFQLDHDWESLINKLLNENLIVTLDYKYEFHKEVMKRLSDNIWKSKNFIPIINLDIPMLDKLNSNLTIRIDDKSLENGGVWCWNCKDLMDSKRFTNFNEYKDDISIG